MFRKEDVPAFAASAWIPYLLATLLFMAIALLGWLHGQAIPLSAFADAHVYARAVRVAAAGGDPYRTDPFYFPFVYPPLVVRCGVLLCPLIAHHLSFRIYVLLTWIGVLSLPWIVCTGYIRSHWLTPWLGMLLFALQPLFKYEGIIYTGNIVLILLPLVLLAGVRGVRRHRWSLFYVSVGLCALIKAPMLALLLLPALSEDRELRPSIITGLCVCAAYLVQRLAMPQAYAEYQRNAWEQVMVHKDSGFNVLNYLLRQDRDLPILRHAVVAFAVQAAVVLLLAAAFYWLRHCREDEAIRPLWAPALLVLSIVADPRLQHIVACAAILPCIYLWVECMRRLANDTLWLRVCVLAFVIFQFLTAKQFELGELILLYGSLLLVLTLAIRRGWDAAAEGSKPREALTLVHNSAQTLGG
jgi:hypothetical protein